VDTRTISVYDLKQLIKQAEAEGLEDHSPVYFEVCGRVNGKQLSIVNKVRGEDHRLIMGMFK